MKARAASALLIPLLCIANPVGAADLVSLGTLASEVPFVVNVDNGLISSGTSIVTVYFLSGGQPATVDTEPRLGKRVSSTFRR